MKDPLLPSSYFTYAEFYEVYRRVAPPDQAEEMARSSAFDPAQDKGDPLRKGQSGSEGIGATAVLTDDTLIMLSLLSPDAEARAAAYRRALRGGKAESQEEQRAWLERRQQFKRWAEAGYPTEPE